MQKLAIFIAVLFFFATCDLAKLEPAQTKSFIKYFGDNGNTEGVALLKLNDGYLLLGNNDLDGTTTTAVLIKVDLNGNLIWNSIFPDIKGSALAKMPDGYFIIGDGIDNNNPLITRMNLIKTNLEGALSDSTSIGETNVAYHGTALTISSLDEIIVCGYTKTLIGNTEQTFLYGYNNDLSPAWTAVRPWGGNGVTRISSKTLREDENGEFVWNSLNNNSTMVSLKAPRDKSAVSGEFPLLSDQTISGNFGDFTYTKIGGIAVQTVAGQNNSAIAITNYRGNEISYALIEKDGSDLSGYAVVESGNDSDYVVLGSTTNSSATRSDLDFYLTKVGIDGKVSSTTGFTNIIGGTGNETGAAIVQADDNGFVFLGTMQNTNDVKLMVLIKVNDKGELIN